MSDADRNEVHLRGRVSGDPREVELPSGEVLVSRRLVVRRPESAKRGSGSQVDTVDVVAWKARPQTVLRAATADDRLEVEGMLRRRFWRSPGGPASRYEVEIVRVRRTT